LRGQRAALARARVGVLADVDAARNPLRAAAKLRDVLVVEEAQELHALRLLHGFGIRGIRHESDIADAGFPAVADEQRALRLGFFGEVAVAHFAENAATKPSELKGTWVRRLTVPAMPPSIMSAVAFLYVSTPAINSGETSANGQAARAVRVEAVTAVEFAAHLRQAANHDAGRLGRKWVVSPEAAKRVTVIPLMRCNASATDLSGNAPMSEAVIESTTVSASFLMSWDVASALRMPVTRISVRSSSDFVVAVFGRRRVLVRRPLRWHTAPAVWLRVREWINQMRAISSRSRLHAATFSMLWTLQCPPCIETITS
jgi:hypothetical protein